MKGFPESDTDPIDSSSRKSLGCCNSPRKSPGSVSGEAEPGIGCSKHQKSAPLWSGIWPPAVSIFGHSSGSPKKSDCSSVIRKKSASGKNYYEAWRAAVRRVMMNGGSMRRYLGFNRTNVSNSNSDIWLLGVCYHVAQEGEESSNPTQSEGFAAFVEDFSSRVLITYRKGFSPIGDSKYSSDVNWGCMLRSSQMLVAQAFLVHKLGRSWRKSSNKPLVESYMEILHLFGDAEDSPFSIHNLLEAGSAYGLAAGSWVGPYAMCRTWESLVRGKREESDGGVLSSMMGLYVVSGDEDGERGGAPVLCIEDISRYCSEFSRGQADWVPILLMVPLVLGLEKVNPRPHNRYLPLLCATFKFPQSLGILGGRPGASTYIVGVQDEKAFYLDPHEVQQDSLVVDVLRRLLSFSTACFCLMRVLIFTISSIFGDLEISNKLDIGAQLHAYTIKMGFESEASVGSSLVIMYSKCGSIGECDKVFQQIIDPDLVCWTTMIASYANNGKGLEALQLFDQLKISGIEPDAVTFVGVLSACSHAGLVDEGYIHLHSMIKDYGIEPGQKHYACMVDILGHAGRLEEAKRFILSMPVKPTILVWETLLAACKVHGNHELGKLAAEKIMELQPSDIGAYISVSNIYAEAGEWDHVLKIREAMEETGVRRKEAGWSYV